MLPYLIGLLLFLLQLVLSAVPDDVASRVLPWGYSDDGDPVPIAFGKPYAFGLNTHCGVRQALFDGRRWIADPPLGGPNEPTGWRDPLTWGAIVLVNDDLVVFTSRYGHIVKFIPWPAGEEWRMCI